MLSIYRIEYVWAAFLLRFSLGMLSFVAGLNKFISGPANFRGALEGMFSKTWLPPFLYVQFANVLPYAEVILGLLIIIGLFRFYALVLGSLLMLSLTFGMIVAGKNDVVSANMIYVALYAATLFTSAWDRISADSLFRPKVEEEQGE